MATKMGVNVNLNAHTVSSIYNFATPLFVSVNSKKNEVPAK